MSAGAFTVAENQTAVGTVVAADGDGTAANNTISYSISGGADAARFTIDADTGALSFAAAPDYEAGQHSFAVTVKASDGTLFSTQDLTVNLANVDEGTDTVQSSISYTARRQCREPDADRQRQRQRHRQRRRQRHHRQHWQQHARRQRRRRHDGRRRRQ